jgi:release factor glutamine methyltransferase
MAYLRGEQAFFGLNVAGGRARAGAAPDTETLVQWALDLLPTWPPTPRVLDLGTGSGAIALALASQRRSLHSPPPTPAPTRWPWHGQRRAAGLARCVSGRATWLQAVPGERFDLVVSNPPYIAEDDPHLAALGHEPAQALTAGPDGLDDLRTIVAQAPRPCTPGAGCCWNTATTRPQRCGAAARAGFASVAAAPTSRASCAAAAGAGRERDNPPPGYPGPLHRTPPMSDAQTRIDQLVKSNDIVLFMKGNASFPMCGFSGRAIQILKASGVDPKALVTVNVLEDEASARASRNTATGRPFPSSTSRASSSAVRTS